MFKKIIIGLGVVVVVLAGGIYYLTQNAGKIVEAMIETQGSRATRVAVAVDTVDIRLTDLKAALRGLTVANPAGFKTPRAIRLGEISAKISEDWSLDVIVIDEIIVNGPEITYEIGANGSNIAAIQSNVESFMKSMSDDTASTAMKDDNGKQSPKIIINHFYFKNGKVNVSASLMQDKTITTALPEIHLKDIGKDKNGASPVEVISQLMSAITTSAGGAAGTLDLSQLGLSDISGKAAEIGAAAQSAVQDAVQGAAQGAAQDAAQDAVKGVGDKLGGAVKGLFGN